MSLLRRRMMMKKENAGMPDNGIIYKLLGKTVFTGSNNIDTGIHLFRDYDSFTLFSDVEFNSEDQIVPDSQNPATIISCMWEAQPYPGFAYRIRNNAGIYITDIIFGTDMVNIVPNAKGKYRIKMAFSVENRTIKNIFYQVNDADLKSFALSYEFQVSGTIENAILTLGSYRKTSGAYGRYFIGDMNQFILYDRAFSNEEINMFFNS